jgi:homoserine kinase
MQGRADFVGAALDDRIHQPYRAALCPLLPCVQELKGQSGILGSALSGAGPSVLIFVNPVASMTRARKVVSQQLSDHGLAAELIPTAITLRGAKG